MLKWLWDFLVGLGGTLERPSPSDIIPQSSIKVLCLEESCEVKIDYTKLNIPFTKHPELLPIMHIPDTNSMDGLMDYGNNPLYIKPTDNENHKIMVDWLADEFKKGRDSGWKRGGANDCVYRIMANPLDSPDDFSKPHVWYSIHRIKKVGSDAQGRWWQFEGINNPRQDPHKARDRNLLFLNTAVIY